LIIRIFASSYTFAAAIEECEQMPGDEHDPVADQLAGEGHRLFGVAEVVAHDQLDILAEDAPLGVEIRDRHPGAAFKLLAAPSHRAGHRTGDGNSDLGRRSGGAERRSTN
jgi:hypothetical protein